MVNRLVSSSVIALGVAGTAFAGDGPGLLVDLDDRERVLKMIEAGDPVMTDARATLIHEAEQAMGVPVRPITAGKEGGKRTAPSGDPRDYVSLSPYWWPNPETEDGLPYVRRDGEVNPDRYEYDTPKLGEMGAAVRTLGFAYSITGDERYAERAVEHVRAWFVDPETRMNPNVRYAQFVPGVADGRHYGIIDTNRLRWVPDAMLMLAESEAWTERDTRETKRWFGEYADWLLASDMGDDERASANNHGTWYAAQLSYFAAYADRDIVVREIVRQIPARIGSQIEPDGSQPHELVRTRALHYCDFNLRAMLDLCALGDEVGEDLASYESPDGASIRGAVAWVMPYLTGEEEWPYQQINASKDENYYQMLRKAARTFDEPAFERAARALRPVPDNAKWVDLILPAIHGGDAVSVRD